MIDRDVKQCLGQMMKGVEVVGATHGGVSRAFTSHWVTQVSFSDPVVMASVSPRHDTHPLMLASREFSISVLAADQVAEGQYFSYPGRKFHHIAGEYLEHWPGDPDGPPVVVNSIAWMRCAVLEVTRVRDHDLFLAEVTAVAPGRLREPPLLYSSRLGWRAAGDRAREPGTSIRDALLERLAAAGIDADDDADETD
ncbi:MAG: flavin reductase family protein [Ilumatobacteraceae bacterium]|jgi:flavin reductase (DIM6/NTAB) family NADH-FMN oxidoreductase RutF